MTDEALIQITIVPTGNEWDAPIGLYRLLDGTAYMTRSGEFSDHADASSVTIVPHGVIYTEGKMSEFDRARQPKEAP